MRSSFPASVVAVASVAAWLSLAPAFADEVTTQTTTTTTRTTSTPVIVDEPPAVVIEHDQPDCSRTQVTKLDPETGDSVTRTRTSCE
jgi:hypothetical protein